MGSIVEFPQRSTGPDPQQHLVIKIHDVQMSLAQSAGTLVSSLAILDESLRRVDGLLCHIDDAGCRARLQSASASIYCELLKAAAQILNSAAPAKEKTLGVP
jgi:hypothetical protein